ncbi:hypothetical protein M3Y99_00124100 [Aphelenchoides fujianensis]|nr:hypothetical protein M3Y99_00124100 [Aphelenchoides fujianensis]
MIWNVLWAVALVLLGRWLWNTAKWLLELEYKRRMCSEIPGPSTLPLIGSMHLFPKELEKIEPFMIEECNKVIRAGGNVMKLWFAHQLRLYLLDSEAVKHLTSSNTELVKGEDYAIVKRWMGEGLLTSDGEKWARARKLLTAAFHFAKLEEYADVIDEHVREFVAILEKRADGQEIDFFHYVKYLTLDIIMQTTMGVNLNLQADNNHPYVKAVQRFSELELKVMMEPLLQLPGAMWLSGFEMELRRTIRTLKAMSTNVIKERLKLQQEEEAICEGQRKRRLDFLDLLLEQLNGGHMSLQEVHENVDTFLFGGHDTTAHALSWIIWCLATNPDHQKRLHDELVEHFGHSDAEFKTSRVKELKFFDAVIKEAMRCYPPVPFVERQLKEEMQIGEHRLPKGACVVIPQMFLHHNEKAFPDHWTFDPERFLDGRDIPPNAYLPFRMRFAQNEIRCTLAHLVHNFEFRADLPMTANWTIGEMVLRPGIGIPVRLTKRLP